MFIVKTVSAAKLPTAQPVRILESEINSLGTTERFDFEHSSVTSI